MACGVPWHKSCLACASCRKSLDSTNLCDKTLDNGKQEVFCKSCYGKAFGPKGYGFGGGAGTLQMTEVSAALPSETISVSDSQISRSDHNPISVPVKESVVSAATGSISRVPEITDSRPPVAAKRGSVLGGAPDVCPRCSKNVYFAEMMQGPGGSKYHKLCFRCTDCDKSLDSMNSCVTTENVLLCKTCYSKKHGPVGFGFRGAMVSESQGKA